MATQYVSLGVYNGNEYAISGQTDVTTALKNPKSYIWMRAAPQGEEPQFGSVGVASGGNEWARIGQVKDNAQLLKDMQVNIPKSANSGFARNVLQAGIDQVKGGNPLPSPFGALVSGTVRTITGQNKVEGEKGPATRGVDTSNVQETPVTEPVKSAPAAGGSGSGGSVVDWMNANGMNSSFDNRARLAKELGIENYTGTAEQNAKLLELLKKSGSAKPAQTQADNGQGNAGGNSSAAAAQSTVTGGAGGGGDNWQRGFVYILDKCISKQRKQNLAFQKWVGKVNDTQDFHNAFENLVADLGLDNNYEWWPFLESVRGHSGRPQAAGHSGRPQAAGKKNEFAGANQQLVKSQPGASHAERGQKIIDAVAAEMANYPEFTEKDIQHAKDKAAVAQAGDVENFMANLEGEINWEGHFGREKQKDQLLKSIVQKVLANMPQQPEEAKVGAQAGTKEGPGNADGGLIKDAYLKEGLAFAGRFV